MLVSTHYERTIRDLLVADPEEVRRLEKCAFDELTGKRPLVLCGAGGLGRKTLQGLRKAGVEPVAFTDNNATLWNTEVEGVPVYSPADAAAKFGDGGAFVVTVWGAHSRDRLAERMAYWRSLGCTTVLSFRTLFWKYPAYYLPHYACDLPHKVYEQAEQVVAAARLWSDDISRSEYLEQLRWRTSIDYGGLPGPVEGPTYFPKDLIRLIPQERFVDCGAFDGDTLRDLVRVTEGEFEKVWAMEPDPDSFAKLRASIATLPEPVRRKVESIPIAAADTAKTLRFVSGGLASSGFSDVGGIEVRCDAIDNVLAESKPTFIKMDIEGAEPDALLGARKLIQECRPILAISAYHLQKHLWEIPLLVAKMVGDYNFHLRPHDLEGWDLVCYAIPAVRSHSFRK